ncbi:hypothetical protein ZWY2020_056280 [Hordeum vulgare]|nr:hypothetical protein ZWY2020_056280 [Hordeum vulgare]
MAIRAGSGDGRSAPCGGAARLEAAARGSAGNDNGNGAATGVARASRKSKPKKIPQRSLGVAQLEKLRIEEQKKTGEGRPRPRRRRTRSTAGPSATSPPQPPLSALSRQAAADHCGFKPALWSPADPAKHSYKRSLCPQPPLPNPMWRLALRREATRSGELGRTCRGDDPPSRPAHAPARSGELLPKGSGPDAAVRHEGWMVRYGRRKIGRSFFHTHYFVLDNKLLAYYKKQPKDNNMVGPPDLQSSVPEFLVRVRSFELLELRSTFRSDLPLLPGEFSAGFFLAHGVLWPILAERGRAIGGSCIGRSSTTCGK